MNGSRATVQRFTSRDVSWETATGAPHRRLQGVVRRYTGYTEEAVRPVRRREVPIAAVPLVLSWGEPLSRIDGDRPGFRSFVAGMSVRSVDTEHAGGQAGVEVVLTPLGARAILGMPLRELADVIVPLDAVLGRKASLWVDELAAARDWTERFAILDRILIPRLEGAADVPPPLVRAMNGMTESAGQVRVDALADGVGWSRRHLSRVFAEQLGLSPKATAKVLRFERATELLGRKAGEGIASVAAAAGYADQSHLNREFRELAGYTPAQWVVRFTG